MITVESIEKNLLKAREMISDALSHVGESGRRVEIMAVTKTHPVEIVEMALAAGVTIIGENRISEGGRKITAVGRDSACWHIIGPLHRKEIRRALRDFHSIDSIDRIEILQEIGKRFQGMGEEIPSLLLEVNTSGEIAKHGFSPEKGVLEEILGFAGEQNLKIDGFLTIGPLGGDETAVRKAFSTLRRLSDELVSCTSHPLTVLSMGMSDDFPTAVKEGATVIRLGRFLFGARTGPPVSGRI